MSAIPGRQRRRRAAVLALAAGLGLAAACGSSGSGSGAKPSPTTALPIADPSVGRHTFAVGQRHITIVDHSRPTAGNPWRHIAAATSRTLPVVIYYPATGPASTAASPSATENAPIVKGKFPLFEFSHGVTASGPAYSALLTQIARAGYIVAAPTFPMTSGEGGWTDIKDYQNQPKDVSFVITRVGALNNTPGDLFQGRIDLTRIAAGGHSLGAITTLGLFNTCCGDSRVRAAVAVSGLMMPFPSGDFSKPPKIPVLLVHGQADGTVPYGGSENSFEKLPGPRAFLTVPKGSHVGVLAPTGDRPLTANLIIAFLDRELRHDPTRWNALKAELATANIATLAVDGGLPRPA